MFYIGVIVCFMSLISGMVCSPSKERNQDSKLQELIKKFEEARQIKRLTDYDKLRELEIDFLTKRIIDKMLNGKEEQYEESTTDGEESEIHEYLRQLESIIDENAVNDLIARTEDILADNVDMDGYKESPVRRCWWCFGSSTKFTGGVKIKNDKTTKIKEKKPKLPKLP